MNPKKIIMMGKGALCKKACQWLLNNPTYYDLQYVVPVIPEPKWTDSIIEFCVKNKIKYLPDGDYKNLHSEIIKSADIVISIFYDKIIKENFINKCNKIINLHNAPLPKYRGVSPINWALKNQEIEHGITIHKISPGIDDGDIISQVKYSIYPEFDEVIDVYNRSINYGYTLFTETLPIIDKITPTKQDDAKTIYYSSKDNNLLGERRNFTKKESL